MYKGKSTKVLRDAMLSSFNALQPDLVDTSGTIARDLFVELPLAMLSAQEVIMAYNSAMATVAGAIYVLNSTSFQAQVRIALGNNPNTNQPYTEEEFTSRLENDIEGLAKNEMKPRLSANYARGVATFVFSTTDAVTIPYGTQIKNYYTNKLFTTTQAISAQTPLVSDGNPYYEISVPVVCSAVGYEGNISSGKGFSVIGTTLANLVRVYNKDAFHGGYPQESLSHLLYRIKNFQAGGQIPQRGGYENFAYANGARDVKVIMPGDTIAAGGIIREGAVDLYVLSHDMEVWRETRTYLPGLRAPLPQQPVNVIRKIVSGATQYTEGIDFSLSKDSGTLGESVQARDKVVWLSGGASPSSGSTITVEYEGNKTVRTMQELLNAGGAYDVIGQVLIKQSPVIFVNIGIGGFTVESDYDENEVKERVWQNLYEYFQELITDDGHMMGVTAYASQVIDVVQSTEGVDYFNDPLVYFYGVARGDVASATLNSTIVAGDLEHLVLKSVSYL